MKVYDFRTQLKLGSDGETAFHALYPTLERLDGRKGDFKLPDGRIIELKSDSWSVLKTPNFFMERWSNIDGKKPGGPWQSLSHGVSLFVYKFSDSDYFWFDLNQLVPFLESKKWLEAKVFNKGWTALGYRVPREALKHLMLEVPECLQR